MVSEFYAIINEALKQAEDVDCDFAVYVEGLEEMLECVRERYALAIDELEQMKERDR